MPKMKTHKGTQKRVKKTKKGKFKRRRAFKGHKLTSKRPTRKRRLRRPTLVPKTEKQRFKQLLPYD